MPSLPTVDVEAPNGGRIVLRPLVQLERLPGLSRGGLAAVVVLGLIFLATSANRLNHTDLWGHLAFGRWIVENGRLPTTDPFRSFVVVDNFVNVPWLAQVLGYACHEALGLEGLVLGHALLVTLAAAMLIAAVCARGVSAGWGAVAAVAAYVLALPITGTIRPQLFGGLAFALTLYAVARLPTRRWPLWWLPPVFALWANLHGSFPMGLAVLGCYALGQTWSAGRAARRDPSVRQAWVAVLLAVAASCLNPYGPRLLGIVAGFSGNTNLAGISEWRPMVLASLSGTLFFGSLVVTAVLLRWSPRPVTATEILLFLAFGLVSLTAIRMLVWWSLLWPWLTAPHAAAAWSHLRNRQETSTSDESHLPREPAAAVQRLLFALVLVGLVIWWSPSTHALLLRHPRPASSVLSTDTPKDLADWMCAHRIHGRIFAPMDWSDYLIWRTSGAVEPLVYSHVHLVSPEVWADFLAIDQGDLKWHSVVDRYRLRYLVIGNVRHRALMRGVLDQSQCHLLCRDQQGALVRMSPTESPIIRP